MVTFVPAFLKGEVWAWSRERSAEAEAKAILDKVIGEMPAGLQLFSLLAANLSLKLDKLTFSELLEGALRINWRSGE